MFTRNFIMMLVIVSSALASQPDANGADGHEGYGLGRAATPGDIAVMDTDVRFDGQGLPDGSGTYENGRDLYQSRCASCHGKDLKGIAEVAPPLAGPGRTIESYWPYAPTVFDYIRRSMPSDAPKSLTDSEVYALVAYLLGEAGLHPEEEVMDATSIIAIEMANENGFVPDRRPDVQSTTPTATTP